MSLRPPAPVGFSEFLADTLPRSLDEQGGMVVGILNLLPTSDGVLRQYIDPARVWSTVTPVGTGRA